MKCSDSHHLVKETKKPDKVYVLILNKKVQNK